MKINENRQQQYGMTGSIRRDERWKLMTILLMIFCFHLKSSLLVTAVDPTGYSFDEELGNPGFYANVDPLDELNRALLSEQSPNLQDRLASEVDQSVNIEGQSEEIYILEDKDYPKSLYEQYAGVGQVSGITTLPAGDVVIFHRALREWDNLTFNGTSHMVNNVSQAQNNLIKNDTFMILDRDEGTSVKTFGSNLFYMPHSVASDNLGNLWVSDVGRHQVMRLPTGQMFDEDNDSLPIKERLLPVALERLWPDIVLGEAFVPGNDEAHFCQPADIAVSSSGRLVFVADGYCNKRIIVFTGQGRFVASFGQQQDYDIVHSLTLFEERNLICAADRERGRIHCYNAGLDGNLARLGELALSVNYPLGRVFAITAISKNHMLVSSNRRDTGRYDLAALNPFTSELKQAWTSSDLLVPHSLAHTMDGQYAYAADMSKNAYRKVFKFNIIQRKS